MRLEEARDDCGQQSDFCRTQGRVIRRRRCNFVDFVPFTHPPCCCCKSCEMQKLAIRDAIELSGRWLSLSLIDVAPCPADQRVERIGRALCRVSSGPDQTRPNCSLRIPAKQVCDSLSSLYSCTQQSKCCHSCMSIRLTRWLAEGTVLYLVRLKFALASRKRSLQAPNFKAL